MRPTCTVWYGIRNAVTGCLESQFAYKWRFKWGPKDSHKIIQDYFFIEIFSLHFHPHSKQQLIPQNDYSKSVCITVTLTFSNISKIRLKGFPVKSYKKLIQLGGKYHRHTLNSAGPISVSLVRLITMCLSETYSQVHTGIYISPKHFLFEMAETDVVLYHHHFSTLLYNMPSKRFKETKRHWD
jgi:hypothetical protein